MSEPVDVVFYRYMMMAIIVVPALLLSYTAVHCMCDCAIDVNRTSIMHNASRLFAVHTTSLTTCSLNCCAMLLLSRVINTVNVGGRFRQVLL